MHISEFDYHLPAELIAQEPLAERDRSRMMIVDRMSRTWRDSTFEEFPNILNPGDLIVINNTRVFPARLIGHRVIKGPNGEERGAQVEALLVKSVGLNQWEVLAKPGRALRAGAEIDFGHGRLKGVVTEVFEEGRRIITFMAGGELDRIIDTIGNTPLPPYIKRDQSEEKRLDEPRYQTVYASRRGAIAAPTAGLHFTPRIFDRLKQRGIGVTEITHHVGYATFQPVRTDQIEEHKIAAENYEIGEESALIINQTKARGSRIVAIGTTSVRALESAADSTGKMHPQHSSTELYIYPGYKFRAIDAMLTNFHLPQSSLLMLVSALADRELILAAYNHAVEEKYRFFSYGDCMLIGNWSHAV